MAKTRPAKAVAKRTAKKGCVAAKEKGRLPTSKSPKADSNTLPVHLNGKTRERRLAEVAIEPAASSAAIANWMTQGTFGETGMGDLVDVLRDTVQAAQRGDLGEFEGMLGAQAYALNAIFLEMTRRAAVNIGQHLPATEQYMRLALKAQSQARTTIEALAEVKNPRAVAFVKQANIANNQQVNNDTRAGETQSPPNELQEAPHGGPVAPRAKGARIGADPGSATVVEINRPANSRRQGQV